MAVLALRYWHWARQDVLAAKKRKPQPSLPSLPSGISNAASREGISEHGGHMQYVIAPYIAAELRIKIDMTILTRTNHHNTVTITHASK